MFADKFVGSFKRVSRASRFALKRSRLHRADVIKDQVRKMLEDSDQKLILMVRG